MTRGFLTALLLVAGLDVAASEECVNSLWTYFNGACYFFGPGKMTYLEAKLSCAAMGHNANLVSIHSDEEQEFLDVQYGDIQYWLGLEANFGIWSWTDGSVFDYSNWHSTYSTAKCPLANNEVPLGKWTTVSCTRKNLPKQGALCKYYVPTQDPVVETTAEEEPVETTTLEPTTVAEEGACSDNDDAPCADLSYLCEDPTYSSLMIQQCPNTCRRCPAHDPPSTCSDKENAPCESLAYLCDVEDYFDLMTGECPNTCNRCPPPCVDKATAPCSLLSFLCEDEGHQELLALECPLTCGFCSV